MDTQETETILNETPLEKKIRLRREALIASNKTPLVEAHVEEAPVEEATVEEATVEEAPVEEAPVEEASVIEAPVETIEETLMEEDLIEEIKQEISTNAPKKQQKGKNQKKGKGVHTLAWGKKR